MNMALAPRTTPLIWPGMGAIAVPLPQLSSNDGQDNENTDKRHMDFPFVLRMAEWTANYSVHDTDSQKKGMPVGMTYLLFNYGGER